MAYLEHAYPDIPTRTTVSPAPRRGKVWTEKDKDELLALAFCAGSTLEKIAAKMKRTPCAIRARMYMIYGVTYG